MWFALRSLSLQPQRASFLPARPFQQLLAPQQPPASLVSPAWGEKAVSILPKVGLKHVRGAALSENIQAHC